ncbi:signal transducer and activator of transcription 5B-like isoform X3 [Ornithodoros turicata]|uniref:signal transducer and activator of transcription 5B-like isoform X3 n=1 Tax=Ornithodoros turicata TaxID=34597 RepID=UPI00313A4D5F
MALWARLQELPREQLRQCQLIYGEHFPIEVRCALAPWIEEKPWVDMDTESPSLDLYAPQVLATLLEELQKKANSEENFVMRLKLLEAVNSFKQNYSHNPGALIRVIKNCLATELRIVQHAENPCHRLAPHVAGPQDPHTEICQQLEKLRRRTQLQALETEEELRRMIQIQESFVIQYQECQKLQALYQQQSAQPTGQANMELLTKMHNETKAMEQAIRQRVSELRDMRMAFADKQQETALQLSTLQTLVLDEELIKWKRAQQLSGNGTPFENNLDQIQEWCETLAELIWQNRQQIKRVEHLSAQVPIGSAANVSERFTTLNAQVTNLLSSLVTSTFIIEKQPPQVMKTNTRFTATVRLLVGGKLNVHMTPPQVKVSIISEAQANALLKSDKVSVGDASGDILNNTGTMEYHQATRQLSVSFRNMQLRKIKRAEKKGTESVMDEKFSLLFQSQFKVGGGELVFQVWTLSLPVVVIVHGNQEPHAWATVTWDNAFAEPRGACAAWYMQGRVPFAVPDKVPWPQLGEVLSMKFRSATGRGLSEDNLRYLAGKIFRNPQLQDSSLILVSWAQFCKEPLPERNFTFWEWFYAIMKVTREHLRAPWNDSVVWGFVGRRQAEDMLRQCCNGTFLLRFSDSELGGVTIAWLHEDPQQDTKEVIMIQPFTSRDFTIRSLADRVSDLQQLTYMYPDIPKDQAFGKYYTPITDTQSATSNGYVKPVLVTQIPGLSGFLGMDSNPSTPQSFFHPHSPDTAANTYHDGSSALDQAMQAGLSAPDLDYMGGDMDLTELDIPVDFSTINIGELVSFTK